MKHLLVLYIHSPSRLSHLRKLRELRRRYRITVVHAKVPDPNYITHFCTDAIAAETGANQANVEAILETLSDLPTVDGIINLSEPFLPIHAMLSKALGLLGPTLHAAGVGRNKYAMRRFARECDIPVPAFVEITVDDLDAARDLPYPAVIKPVVGSGSSLVRRVETFDELRSALPELAEQAEQKYRHDSQFHETYRGSYPFIAEEIIGGDLLYDTALPVHVGEISVESLCHDGEVHVLAIHDKPIPANGPYFEEVGYSTPSRIPPQLYDLARRYVTAIHRNLGPGSFVLHTEFRTFADDLVLLEFGIRMGGAAIYNSLLASTGIDFVQIQAELVLGEPLTWPEGDAKPTITTFLFPEQAGVVSRYIGEPAMVRNPCYVEHQLYDDVGEMTYRAPLAARSTMHAVFSDEQFDTLESEVLSVLSTFRIEVTE